MRGTWERRRPSVGTLLAGYECRLGEYDKVGTHTGFLPYPS
jgi:hypothetical protein